jgi:gliding motility-associated-like protein
LKRIILLSCLLFVFITHSYSSSSDRYWVGGSGQWLDAAHWSDHSGGRGGVTVPGSRDNVFFDSNSFTGTEQDVLIRDSAFCANFSWSVSDYQPSFSSASSKSFLSVAGSFLLPDQSHINFQYEGSLKFSAKKTSRIDFSGNRFAGTSLTFDGGEWQLLNDINANWQASLVIGKGKLYTNSHNLCFGHYQSLPGAQGQIDLGKSSIVVQQSWNIPSSAGVKLLSENANFYFNDAIAFGKFKKSSVKSHSVNRVTGACSPSGNGCLYFTISLTAKPVKCNGDCNGVIKAVVVGGTPPYTYVWNPNPTGSTADTSSSLCANTYLVQVTDNEIPKRTCFCTIAVTAPPSLFAFSQITTDPLCAGSCNGIDSVVAQGGIGAYTFSWSTAPSQSSPKVTNLCNGSYTCTVHDANNCFTTTSVTMTDPQVLVANGSKTNIKCFGNASGKAQVAPAGGTTPYTYSWKPGGATTASISGLTPGNYTCTIVDNNGCSVTYVANITQPAAPLSGAPSSTNNPLKCSGDCNATANVVVNGGTPAYTYSWLPGNQTTSNITNLCVGSYTLTTTDANACTLSNVITITQPPALAVTVNTVNLTCNGICNGSASTTVTGGTLPFTYSWNTGGTTSGLINLCAGTYTVKVTDANGCSQISTGSVTQPPGLGISMASTNVPCFGFCNGSATATLSGGTPGYTETWSPGNPTGQGTTGISNLCPGTYTLLIHDSKGCSNQQAVTIIQSSLLVPNATAKNQSCAATCNGSVTANASGGAAPYTYSWTPGGAGQTKTSLCAGTYTVTVTDANGCSKTQAVTVKAPVVLNVTISTTAISCNGSCNGTAAANVTGGTAPYTYSWSPGGQTSAAINSLCVGSYTVTVSDSSACSFNQVVNLTQPAVLAPNGSSSPVACSGTCTGSTTAAPTGGTAPYTYSWSPGGQTTSTVINRCAGNYTVLVTDAHGCAQNQIITVISPAVVSPSITTSNVKCSGACNGSATANPSGGTGSYTYSWKPGNQTTASINGLCSGNYTCTVTDANGCKGTQVVTINQPPSLSASISSATTTCGNCQGSASVAVSGGTPGYTFSWNTVPVQTGPAASSLCVGNYTCTVTDVNACVSATVATITQTVFINVTSSGSTLSCYQSCDGIASANASGGTPPYTYSWNPTAPPQTTQNATNLCAGTYTVTAIDSNGCFNTATVNFSNPPKISPVITKTNAACNGVCNGSASASVSGGTGAYTYSWSPGGQTTSTVNGLCAGTYTLTVSDSKSCDSVVTVIIGQPVPIVPNPSVTPPSTCSVCDGAITVAPSGGAGTYTYSWAPGGSTAATISGLCTGVYTVTIKDANGCDTVTPINVSSPTGPTATLGFVPPSCNGACDGSSNAVVSGGTAPYTYTWSPAPVTGQGTINATGICAGNYNFTVKDKNGCIKIIPEVITQPQALSVTSTVTNVTCGGANDGIISVIAAGGTPAYTYSWSPGGQTTPTINGLAPGNDTLNLKDSHGCSLQVVFTITQPAPLTVTVNTVNVTCHGLCNGTAATTVAGGTTPYTYSWSTGQVSPNISNLCPGSYSVTVTGAHGCAKTQAYSITEPALLSSSVISTNATCAGLCNGSATVTVVGGTSAYASTWAPGSQTGATVNGLCAGAYSVSTTDANGCTIVSNLSITDPPPITLALSSTNTTCNGSCNGTATGTPGGGTGAYTYSWSPSAQTTPTANGLCAGTYTLNVLDANGCSNSQTVTINQPVALASNAFGVNPSCSGLCNGSSTSNPVGGTAPYVYSWSTGGTGSSISNLCSGSYTVNTTDSKGCTASQVVVISNPAPITSANAIAPANCGVCDGTISVTPSGGTAPYSFFWTPTPTAGQGSGNISSLCAGNYVVKITDNNGCISKVTLIENNSGGPTSDTIATVSPTCYQTCNASANVTAVVGGTPNYTYAWFDSLNTNLNVSTQAINNLCAGGYILKVTDASGCIYSQSVHIGTPLPFATHAAITQTSCSGLCNGSISLSPTGGTGAYTYSWSNGLAASASQINLCAGNYTVQITDGNGCDSSFIFILSPQSLLLDTVTFTNPPCTAPCNGTATITMTAGTAPYTYHWTDPLGQVTATASGLCAGSYTVTVFDANGCNIQKSATLSAPALITGTPSLVDPLCGSCNGSATLTPAGGTLPYTYNWSSGAITGTASNLCAGVYSVNVTDANGCNSSFTIPLSNSSGPGPSTVSITPTSCPAVCDGAASVTANGGTAPYTYSWSPGAQATTSISAQCAGLYLIQVTDSKGCVRIDSANITQPAALNVNQAVVPATCHLCNGSITLNPSGGFAPYTYSWSGGLPPISSQTALCAATYSVTLTDSKGCSGTFIFTVNSSSGPSLVNTSTNVNCFGSCNGKDSVTASGGGGAPYTYNWSPAPGGGQATPTATGLCPGSYTVQVFDAQGCANSTHIVLTQPQAIVLNSPSIVNVKCNSICTGSATAIAMGGIIPYTYSWTGGSQTGAKDTALCAGTYTVTVTDANVCSQKQVVTITEPSILAFTDVVTNPHCDNVPTGSAVITPAGGTTPYSYSWTGPAGFSSVAMNLNGQLPGIYSLKVTDANGCNQILPVTLTPAITLNSNAGNNLTFCTAGAVTLDGSMSTNAATYNWYQMPGMVAMGSTVSIGVTPPNGTTNYILIIGNSGCTDTSTVAVTSNPPPVVSAGISQTILTNETVIIGGNPTCVNGVTYHWSPPTNLSDTANTNPSVSPLVTTTYTVSVTDINGCTGSDTIQITVLPQLSFANGITPNGDGANDVWVIDNIHKFPNNQVEIYNRWGELLFQAKDYQNNWDGTYKGKPLPVGTYYYLVDLHDPLYKTKYSGPITILR